MRALEERVGSAAEPPSRLGPADVHLFHEGTHRELGLKLGAHPFEDHGRAGVQFAVWAPNASSVSVIGDFNGWDPARDPLRRARLDASIWEGFVAGLAAGARYKFRVVGPDGAWSADKADPFARASERAPATASIVQVDRHAWRDGAWIATRASRQQKDRPISIYEVHLGSWWRDPARPREFPRWREIAPRLAAHVLEQGFTHVELLPLMQHPFYGSWGYEVTGYFAPDARYGAPEDLMHLVDVLHQAGIGVVFDWVPAHFPEDEHGLSYFDGTHLYAHPDPRRGRHPDWGTMLFDFERREVWSFLVSSACSWLERFHGDGLRLDAVASMLHLDFGREGGEWLPNADGGRENHAAAEFLRELSRAVRARVPGALLIGENSTTWPAATRDPDQGGLGFDLQWDLGWMHDTLDYLALDPVLRAGAHRALTFRGMYAADEDYLLPLGHDEVVYGKRSLLEKMPGDRAQQHANLRLLFAWMFAQTGKKLLFMGAELAESQEWWHERGLDWPRAKEPLAAGVQAFVRELHRLYRAEPALHELDCASVAAEAGRAGFEWLVVDDAPQSVTVHLRRGRDGLACLCAFNFTPVARAGYRAGIDGEGAWRLALDSDAREFGGGGHGALARLEPSPRASHGRPRSVELVLPPLSALFYLEEPRTA